MKIDSLTVSNFRGVRHAEFTNLGEMVIVAGPNGSGKSCVYDAIRLLKSVYGGYQQNEWHQWMGEFQINFTHRQSDLEIIFNDRKKEVRLSCQFRLHPEERTYLQANAKEFLRQSIWRMVAPEVHGWSGLRVVPLAAQLRVHEQEVERRTEAEYSSVMLELAKETLTAELVIEPSAVPRIANSKVLEIVFSNFRPQNLGVIDYHGAQRFFGRESVQGINLNLDAQEQQHSQHALYNYANKYTNVKGEMAASYVKEVLAERAGAAEGQRSSLTQTLTELFATFFPDKVFLGPKPTVSGLLEFPVRTSDGSIHDLNELSAGEKEILFGYLRLRNSAPRFSIVLLDEPELHLNPRLIRGLPQFYRQHLGLALDNQLWLVTHSDTLLREVVGKPGYNVYHMMPSTVTASNESQARPLNAGDDVERVVISLVGDLAAYRPGGKVVVFEGGGDSEFDQQMVGALFPKFIEQVNAISGGNKARVRSLHDVLDRAASVGKLPFKVFSIVDKDSDDVTPTSASRFSWDVYHIENYLLEPEIIQKALQALELSSPRTELEIYDALREAARETMDYLVRHKLSTMANTKLVSAISTSSDPNAKSGASALFEAIERSADRVNTIVLADLNAQKLESFERELITRYSAELGGDSWRTTFRGRDILKRFCAKNVSGVSYEAFRNIVVSIMKDTGFQPLGMARIVQSILKD